MRRLALIALLCGCGGSKSIPAQDLTPSWLAEGNGAVATESGRQIHAIGVAQGKMSRARRTEADQKAKELMAQTMDQVLAAVARGADASQEAIVAVGRRAAAASAKIMDHWVAADGTESALDVLDLAAFKQALQVVDGDDDAKRELARRIDRIADEKAQR